MNITKEECIFVITHASANSICGIKYKNTYIGYIDDYNTLQLHRTHIHTIDKFSDGSQLPKTFIKWVTKMMYIGSL